MCRFCAFARDNPDYPVFQAKCRGCTIRGLAQSPAFHQAEASQGSEPYQKALKHLLGEDWRTSHQEVLAEAARIMKHRENT